MQSVTHWETMPVPYIDFGGSLMLQPPYMAENVGFYGFPIKADLAALQTLCDERLNGPSGGTVDFSPAGPYVIVAFNRLDKLYSQNPPDREKGWFSEQECAIWTLLVERKQERKYWFHPYIFVDNAYAMALGREVYGFPKAIGWFDIPADPAGAKNLSLETLVLPKFSPETQGVRRPLITARWNGPSWPFSHLKDKLRFLDEVLGVLESQGSLAGDLELLIHSITDLAGRTEPMVFLKQFPMASVAGEACYRSIVEMSAVATAVHGASLLGGDWSVEITPADSHPIGKDLGLSSNTLQPLLGFYVSFDMTVGLGKEL